jgi:hypothetical protein
MRSPDSEESVSSADLVPGDVVVIPPGGCELNFDGVLISGTAIGIVKYCKTIIPFLFETKDYNYIKF